MGLLMAATPGIRGAWGAPVPAGTVITNTATGSFVDAASGTVHLTSNTVNAVVQPQSGAAITVTKSA